VANIITISSSYSLTAAGVVDLSPKKWSDVKDWYIKWDTLHVQFEGDEDWVEFDINSDASDGMDWKRPESVDIYAGNLEFEEELVSTDYY
jgi:hypothetical protein